MCLFDFDFRAPSQHVWFKTAGGTRARALYWLNDFLNGKCSIKDALVDASGETRNSYGKLLIGLANPATDAIREMSAKDRKWELKALGRLLSVRNSLSEMGIDYLIIDSSPGLAYSSINAIVSSDLALIVGTTEASDLEGTRGMLHELYDLFDTKSAIVLNRLLKIEDIPKLPRIEKDKSDRLSYDGIPLLNIIPCFCDVQIASSGYIFAKEEPDHPFTRILENIASSIESRFLPPIDRLQDMEKLRRYRDMLLKKSAGIYMTDEEEQ